VSGLISYVSRTSSVIGLSLALVALSGCSSSTHTEVPDDLRTMPADYTYVIGPGDSMEVFVWGNEELTINGVKVRPDGKISTRLVENIEASGKTPSELARDIEEAYSEYVKVLLSVSSLTTLSVFHLSRSGWLAKLQSRQVFLSENI